MDPKTRLQTLLAITGFLMLVVYHIYLYYLLRKRPESTSIGVANHLRVLWVRSILTENNGILAVQTLRNLTTAATFLASTSIIIGLGVLNIALTTEEVTTMSRIIELDESANFRLWITRLFVLFADFMFCFFNFMLAVRYYNHAAFMLGQKPAENMKPSLHKPGLLINLPSSPESSIGYGNSAADTVNRGAAHYTLGMRGYYLVIPFALWLIGAVWFLLGTILLIIVLNRIDRAA